MNLGSDSLIIQKDVLYKNKTSSLINKNKKVLYKSESQKPYILQIENVEEKIFHTLKNIIIQKKIKGYDDILNCILIKDFLKRKDDYKYFDQCFQRLISKKKAYHNEDKVDDLIRCFICIIEEINDKIKDKHNSDGEKIWPKMDDFIKTLKSIYFPKSEIKNNNSVIISKEIVPLLRNMFKSSCMEHKYFELLKIIVCFYNKNTRLDFLNLIKKLFDKCDEKSKIKFIRRIDSKAINSVKSNDYLGYILMSMLIQVWIIDILISLNSAFRSLKSESSKINKELISISNITTELPNFPTKFCLNKEEKYKIL